MFPSDNKLAKELSTKYPEIPNRPVDDIEALEAALQGLAGTGRTSETVKATYDLAHTADSKADQAIAKNANLTNDVNAHKADIVTDADGAHGLKVESGTWTGILTGHNAAPAATQSAIGRYTKIGNMVTIQINFSNKDTTGAAGIMKVTGLPFSVGVEGGYGSCIAYNLGDVAIVAKATENTSEINFIGITTGSAVNISAGPSKYLSFGMTYITG